MQDTFNAMAYGMYPMCVQEDPDCRNQGFRFPIWNSGGDTLLFRRSTGPTERDRLQRLASAAQDLQSLDDVIWYNTNLGGDRPLHVQSGALTVAWNINGNAPTTHVRVIPALLRWTRWDHDAPWITFRVSVRWCLKL